MERNEVAVKSKIEIGDLVDSLRDGLPDKDLIEFILSIDSSIEDWEFTLNLLDAVASVVCTGGDEVLNLGDSYHEKLRTIIRKLGMVTWAPVDQRKRRLSEE